MQHPLSQPLPAERPDGLVEQDAYAEFWACVEDESVFVAPQVSQVNSTADAYELFLDSAEV